MFSSQESSGEFEMTKKYSKENMNLPAQIQTTATFALANFEKFTVNEKSGKRCDKSGKHWIKSGNQENLRRFIFFLYPRLNLNAI